MIQHNDIHDAGAAADFLYLSSGPRPVFRRCHARDGGKDLGEIIPVAEMERIADFRHAFVRRQEQRFRVFDSGLLNVITQLDPHFPMEFFG